MKISVGRAGTHSKIDAATSGCDFSMGSLHLVGERSVTTFQQTLSLSKPKDREKIDVAALGYLCQRTRGLAYNTVITEFQESGISQADLAGRLNKGADQISRWLGSPGNWTFDTYTMLL